MEQVNDTIRHWSNVLKGSFLGKVSLQLLAFALLFVPVSVMAQHKLFAVSGQGRGSPAEARQAAEIAGLQNEIKKRDVCQSAGLLYSPGHADADENDCISLVTPPTCSGGSQALQWNGTSWSCQTLIRECRACVRIGGNSTYDGDKVCTSYSSAGQESYSGYGSDWALANDGPLGGGKYKVGVWIQCR